MPRQQKAIAYETWLTIEQTCDYLGVSRRWLLNQREEAGGPPYEKRGKRKVVYPLSGLMAYRQRSAVVSAA